MENFVKLKNVKFKEQELNTIVEKLKSCFDKSQNNFSQICYCVHSICKWFDEHPQPKEVLTEKYYNKYELLAGFGFDKSAISRLSNCFEKFVINDSNDYVLGIEYKDFTQSKLYELLPLEKVDLTNLVCTRVIKPEMSVKQIRKIVKSYLNQENESSAKVEINEEDIPNVYDPKQTYSFDYFNSMTKNELVNMIMMLQEEYQKMKKEKRK